MSKGKVHMRRDPGGDGARFSRCGCYELPIGLPAHDPRRERLTSDESAVDCDPCKADLRGAVDDVVNTAKGQAPKKTKFGLDPHRYGSRKAIPLRERDLEEHPRFATWRSAVRAYIRAQDEGVPIKSVSDPARFEAIPQGTSLTHEGDAAQRQVHRLGEVGAALGRAFPYNYSVSPPARTLPAAWCYEILILRVVGRPFKRNPTNPLEPRAEAKLGKGEKRKVAEEEFRGAVRKKSWIAERGDFDSGKYAEHLSQVLGWEVTVGDLGHIEDVGARNIEDELYRRGLVSHRDEGLRKREAAVVKNRVLVGEKAIAEYMGWNPRRVNRARSYDPPIPVRVVGGRLEADPAELDTWRENGARAKAKDGGEAA